MIMDELLNHIAKIHTTDMGVDRIKKNLKLTNEDAVEFCKSIITDTDSEIARQGKNWYIVKGNIRITVNAYSYTIITAHMMKK